ncbi:MAG: thiosulfate sulfurtransferase [Alphaproteobacteria bacterium]|nr:thiosulfate sulfurtransferase [Alphaproteobacteria bacterium]
MPPTVSSAALHDRLTGDGEIALLDMREQGVFSRDGHPLLAVNVPASRLELLIPALVPRRSAPVVVMDGGSGDLATLAAATLAAMGYIDVAVLDGGAAAWKDAGGELYTGINVPSKAFGELVERESATPHMSATEVARRIVAGDNMVVLDSWPFAEYRRVAIPTSIDAPSAELVYRLADVAPDPATLIVVNCAGRTRSIVGAQSLIDAGVPNRVVALENGTMVWELAGLEIERGTDRVAPVPSPAGLRAARERARAVAGRFGVETIDAAGLTEWRAQRDRRTLFVCDVRSLEEYTDGHLSDARSTPGGQLVQATDDYVGVRNARFVLVDDTEVRASMAASWLIRLVWRVVRVLQGGMASLGETLAPGIGASPPTTLRDVALLDSDAVAALLATGGAVVLDLDSSIGFRTGHISGAWWGVRSRLAMEHGGLPCAATIVLTSADGAVARLAAPELAALRPGTVVYVLDGGTTAWRAAGRPLEYGFARPLSKPDDVNYRAYDRNRDVAKAAQAYLDWETGLVAQAARGRTVPFRLAGAR